MDVYEQEFGDLLVARKELTLQERFYSENIKKVITLYNFLPGELIECRMQKYWEKFLVRNPHLRKKHEAEVKAMQALCSSVKLDKAPQRKSRQRFRANLQSRRTRRQEAGRMSGDSIAQADPSRPPGGRKRAVEQHYPPLDIQATRSFPAPAEPGKQLTVADQATEEPGENKEKRREEGLPVISEVAATKMGSVSQQDDAPPNIVAHFEESKFSFIARTKDDTKHTTSSSSSTRHAHNAAHEGPLSTQANANVLEPLQQQRGKAGTHPREGSAGVSDSRYKPDGCSDGRETKESATSGLCLHKRAPMDSSAIVEQDDGHETRDCTDAAGKQKRGSAHFASQLTVSISPSTKDNSGEVDTARKSSDSTEGVIKKEGTMLLSKPGPPASDCTQAESENKENAVKQSEASRTSDQKIQPRAISDAKKASPQKDLLECNGGKRQRNKLSLQKLNKTTIAASTTTLDDSKSIETRFLKEPSDSVCMINDKLASEKCNPIKKVELAQPLHTTTNDRKETHAPCRSNAVENNAKLPLLAQDTTNKERCISSAGKSNELQQKEKQTFTTALQHDARATADESEAERKHEALKDTTEDTVASRSRMCDKMPRKWAESSRRLPSAESERSSGNYAAMAKVSAPEGHDNTGVKTPRKLPSVSGLKSVATKSAAGRSSDTQQNATIIAPASHRGMFREAMKEAGRQPRSEPLTSNIENEGIHDAQKDLMAQFDAPHKKMLEKQLKKPDRKAMPKAAADKSAMKGNYVTQTDATVNSAAEMSKVNGKIPKVTGRQTKCGSLAEGKDDTKQDLQARSMALDDDRMSTKGIFKKRAGADEKNGPAPSSRFAEGKKNVTTSAALRSPAQPQQRKLRDKTPRKMTRSSTGLATPGMGGSPSDKPIRGKPAVAAAASWNKDDRCSHLDKHGRTYGTETSGEKPSKMAIKDTFKTPNLVRPNKAECPPTPLKQHALKRALKKMANQSGKEQLAVSGELQSDSETPFGFKIKRLKLQLERCDMAEKMLQTRGESLEDVHSEKHQALLYTKRAQAEAGTATNNGCKVGDSDKGRNKPGKNIKRLKSSSTTQPEIPAHSDEEEAGNANEQPEMKCCFKDKKSSAPSTEPPRSSVEANAKKTKRQLGSKSSKVPDETGQMSRTANSQNLASLTQHPYVEERLTAAQIKLSVETKAHPASAFKSEKEDGLPCFIETLDECILYSQVETKKDNTYTAAARDAFMVKAEANQGLANMKHEAEQRRGHTGVSEQRVSKFNRPKQGGDMEDMVDSSREFWLNTRCSDNSSAFFDFDAPAAERHVPSTGFLQIKLTATPLSFSDDKDEAHTKEVFPWLASSTGAADTRKSSQPVSQQDDMSRSHLKHMDQEASQRPPKVDTNSAGSELAWDSQKTPGQREQHIVSSHNHDDSDSEYGDFPPLLSRMQVAVSDAICDDDFEHALDDDFELALDDDFPPLESP